jgi:hypothetical protein
MTHASSSAPSPRAALRRAEKEEMRAGDDLIRQLGGEIVSFAQPRNTMQTAGIADRRYRYRGVAFWFEWKAADGKLAREQYEFLKKEYECGQSVAAGSLEELQHAIAAIQRWNNGRIIFANLDVPRSLWTTVERIAARGFRSSSVPQPVR